VSAPAVPVSGRAATQLAGLAAAAGWWGGAALVLQFASYARLDSSNQGTDCLLCSTKCL
jgi:hypothetical protein